MSDEPLVADAAVPASSARRWLRGRGGMWLRAGIGLTLMGLAVGVVLSHRGTLTESYEAIQRAHPAWIVLLLLLPLGNVVFTSLTFVTLTGRYARVPHWEMNLLMLSAGLLNYLPMRPGLVGRVAYHRKVHGIRAADSAKVVLVAMLATALGLGGLLAAALAAHQLGVAEGMPAVGATTVPAIIILLIGHALLAKFPDQHRWRLLIATGWRWGDMLLWAARYAVVFILVGEPVSWAEATQFALISQIALVVPLVGNGLGLREWAIGAFAGRGASEPEALAESAALGLGADLINRAAELIVLVPLGALAGVALARRARSVPKPEPV